jgi:hypothetical protein
VQVPRFGPSENTEVRFMRLPPSVPVGELGAAVQSGTVAVRPVPLTQVPTWTRVRLPHSGTLPVGAAPASSDHPTPEEILSSPGFGFDRPTSRGGSSTWTPPRSGRTY